MKDEDRAAHLEWCRAFIDHNCVLRSPPGEHLIIAGNTCNSWQFYLPVATLDQEFGHRIGLLFWDRFTENYLRSPFQLCACESGGVPVACALQAAAPGFGVNVIEIKKQAKTFGIGNWLEGIVPKDLPVLLIDDVVGKRRTLTEQAKRLVEFGLTLYSPAWAIASCKDKPPLTIDGLGLGIETLFGPDDFSHQWGRYVAKYRKQPQFQGSLR